MPIPSRDRKLAEMILFVSERSEGDPRFGATKLNKLLFYADFSAYLLLGKSITGQAYQRLPQGPAPRRLLPVRKALVRGGELAIRRVEYFNRRQDRTFALRSARLSHFSADEVALVTAVIEQNWDKNASEISYLSHQFHGWEDAEELETIPYEVALLSTRPPSQKDRRRCLADSEIAAAIHSGKRPVKPLHA